MKSLQERVADGARLLDFVEPDWATKVDPADLDMANTTTDVHALVFDGARAIGYDIDSRIEAISVGIMPDGFSSFDELTSAWQDQIKERTT